jgi:hypothetical protein
MFIFEYILIDSPEQAKGEFLRYISKNDLYDFNYIIIFIIFFCNKRYDYYIMIITNKNLENFLK